MRLLDFWTPLGDPGWRKLHILAHLLGGVGIALFLHGPWWEPAWAGELWQRFLWVFAFQALWERIQQENWRPELLTPPGGSGYPWWSAVWDVLLTLAGFAAVEALMSGVA